MKIKAIRDFQGSLNGFEMITFEKGTVLDVEDETANIFLNVGFCETVMQKQKNNAD